jgi:hypothetical protein
VERSGRRRLGEDALGGRQSSPRGGRGCGGDGQLGARVRGDGRGERARRSAGAAACGAQRNVGRARRRGGAKKKRRRERNERKETTGTFSPSSAPRSMALS